MKDERLQNKLIFYTAIQDAFRDEDDRELNSVGKIELSEGKECNDEILDLFYAFNAVFNKLTGSECDPLDFINILIRLLFQDIA